MRKVVSMLLLLALVLGLGAPVMAQEANPSVVWPKNTAGVEGIRFRDIKPELTSKWYMFVPVDLRIQGEREFRLLASNARAIGKVVVLVEGDEVTLRYEVDAQNANINSEFFTFFPDLASISEVNPENLADQAHAFGEALSIKEDLSGKTGQLLYVLLNLDYRPNGDGVQGFSPRGQDYQERASYLVWFLDASKLREAQAEE